MAEPMTDFFTEPVLEILSDAGAKPSRRWSDWLRDVTRPPRGLRVVTDDGAVYNGVVVIRQNQVVAALVMTVGPRRSNPVPPVPPAPDEQAPKVLIPRP